MRARWIASSSLLFAFALYSGDDAAPATPPADGDEVVIASRPQQAETRWLKPNRTYAAYQADLLEICKLLGSGRELKSQDENDITASLRRDPDKAGKGLIAVLDWRNQPKTEIRHGALRAIKIAGPKEKIVGPALAGTVMSDPDKDVREAGVKLIRERKDGSASVAMVDHLFKAYDDSGTLLNQNLADAAVKAIQAVGDKRVFELLLYYVTLEVRAGSSSLVRLDQQMITGGNGMIAMPIQLPVLELISAQGTICIPARAILKQVTGQDLGRDIVAWREWIKQQPAFKQ